MATQPITAYSQDTGLQTVFSRVDRNQADNRSTRQIFSRNGDSYTVNRETTDNGAVQQRSATNTNRQNGIQASGNASATQNPVLTNEIRDTANLYREIGPRNIAGQRLFTSQYGSQGILGGLAETFGTLIKGQNTGTGQSPSTTDNNISEFASLYLTAGPRLLNTGSLFSANSIFSSTSALPTTAIPQITYLNSIQTYLSTNLFQNVLGGGLNLFV